jgi:DNA-binding MarR family transcriptional regulator
VAETSAADAGVPNVGVLLFVAYRAMERRVFDDLAEVGFGDVTPAQARVFQRIGPDGTRLSDLAEQAQVTKQTVGVLVDALERAGYVRRTPDPTDARARLVRVSDRGAEAVAAAAAVVAQVEAEWVARLGSGRFADLRRTLLDLRPIIDPYA